MVTPSGTLEAGTIVPLVAVAFAVGVFVVGLEAADFAGVVGIAGAGVSGRAVCGE